MAIKSGKKAKVLAPFCKESGSGAFIAYVDKNEIDKDTRDIKIMCVNIICG